MQHPLYFQYVATEFDETACGPFFLCTENPQLGWGFRKAFSFEPVIKTPFDLLKHLAVWQQQV
ncbi:hypothetical protein LNN30_11580, partial [Escherichia fergusonii]|uniref:hypothetical protein n=1 Tax=Escherichia fergusonii TaxID=564 RepID=UPI001E49DCAD